MDLERPPRPPAMPIIGHTLRWARNPFTIGSWVNDEVGGVATIELLNTELVLVSDPAPIEEVLVNKRSSFPKSEQYRVVFGDGLGSVSGEQWRQQRDLTAQFFRPTRIDSYADSIVSLADSRSRTWADGEEVPLFDEMKDLTLQILFETIFNYSIDPWGKDAALREAVDDLDEWFRPTSWVLPAWVPTPARRRFYRAASRVDAIAEALLNDVDAGDEGLLATLQELSRRDESALTRDVITSQLRTFLFAGHETTATTVSIALYLLSTHPDVESRFHDELDAVVGESKPRLGDLEDLEVTENIVRETLRLYPPAFRLPRVAAEDAEIGGYRIEAGTDVLVFTAAPHRDERFWEAPTAFRPDRWSDTDPDSTGFEYIPFGAGPRRCIGERFALLETRLLLATLGRQLSFEPQSDLSISARVAATPAGSLPASVERRPRPEEE